MSLMDKQNIYLLWLFFLLPCGVMAESTEQLHKRLEKAREEEKSRLYHDLAEAYYYQDSLEQSAAYYLQAAENELKKENPDYQLVCESFGNAGYVFNQLDRYQDAVIYSKRCYDYAVTGNIPREMSASLVNKGIAWFNLGDYEKSASCYLEAIEIDKSSNDTLGLSVNYNNLGKVFEIWEDYSQALDYYQKSLELSELQNDSLRIAVRLSSVGMAYRGMKGYEKALAYLNRSVSIDSALGLDNRLAIRYSNIGSVYQDTEEYQKAAEYYNQAIAIFRVNRNMRSLAITLNQQGNLYLVTGEYKKAFSPLNESLQIAQETENLQLVMKNNGDLAKAYERTGDYQNALVVIQQYYQLKDSLFNEASKKALEELRIINELDKSEAEIELLKQERELQDFMLRRARFEKAGILAFGLTALVFLVIISRLYRQKSRVTTDLQTLNAAKDKFFTIISHDMKNPVSAFRNISGGLLNALPGLNREDIKTYMVELQKSAEQLNELLQNLLHWAQSQANINRNHHNEIDPAGVIQKALEQHHFFIRQKDINVKTSIDGQGKLIADKNLVLTVLRNLLSNAVRYSGEGSEISVSYRANGSHEAIFSVSDTGPGMSENEIQKLFRIDIDPKTIGSDAVIEKGKGSGLGLILCHELLQKAGGKIWVNSSQNKGSTFSFSLPVTR